MSDRDALRDALGGALEQTCDVHTIHLEVYPEVECRACGAGVRGVYEGEPYIPHDGFKAAFTMGGQGKAVFAREIEHEPDCWIVVARAALGNAP